MAGHSDSKCSDAPCGGPTANVVKQSPSESANKALRAQHGDKAAALAPTRPQPVKG